MWCRCNLLVLIVVFLCRCSQGQEFENNEVSKDTTSSNLFSVETETEEMETESTTSEVEYVLEENTTFPCRETTTEQVLAKCEKKISDTILEMMEHFQKPNPEGIPGVDIPDPYGVPDMKKSVTFFDVLYLEYINVYGLSKMKVLNISVDFVNMEVNAAMEVDELETRGTYRYSSLLMPRKGLFTVNVTGLKLSPRGKIGVEIDGRLRTQDINIDISFDTIVVNFENLGSLGNILQGFINTAGHFIFENIKPHILRDTYSKARQEMDKKIDELCNTPPRYSLSPS